MNSKTALLSAVLSALALIATGASAATRTETPAAAPVSALTTLAKDGADDAINPFDDHGVDFILGKNGADDAVQTGDDNGVDFVLAKHRADDLVDGEDDHGIDLILG